MQLQLATALLLVAAASVHAGLTSRHEEEPAWMIMPDEDGIPHVAVLRGPLPETRLDPFVDITFFLYTRSNPTVPVQVWVDNLNGSPYAPTKPVKMLMHGYTANASSPWIIEQVDSYIRSQDVNVVTVEWGELAAGPLYNLAQARTKAVGDYMGKFFDFLASQGGDPATFHCIGHSLGAHGCGVAGKVMTSGVLGRATGLDPALPLYNYNETTERLTADDAAYVDAIHTCGGSLGFVLPLGDADFYPNEGVSSQPGCGIDLTGGCSHGRSHEFFGESIESNGFVSHLCGSWAEFNAGQCSTTPTSIMGEGSDPSSQGSYYLQTRRNPPFAQG